MSNCFFFLWMFWICRVIKFFCSALDFSGIFASCFFLMICFCHISWQGFLFVSSILLNNTLKCFPNLIWGCFIVFRNPICISESKILHWMLIGVSLAYQSKRTLSPKLWVSFSCCESLNQDAEYTRCKV